MDLQGCEGARSADVASKWDPELPQQTKWIGRLFSPTGRMWEANRSSSHNAPVGS